jgi:hypothetical protein
MPPCDRCVGDAFLREAGFTFVYRDGQRYIVRGKLVYPIEPECRVHAIPEPKAA